MRTAVKTVTLYATAFVVASAVGYTASGSVLGGRAAMPLSRATWIERHSSLASLAHSANAVVVGKVADIRLGRIVAGEESDGGSLQFSNVVLRVSDVVKGDVRPGDDVTVEIVGDYVSDEGPRPGRIDGMPDFHKGERFLLFLKRQTSEPYEWYVLNNQAAFEVLRGGPAAVLQAVDHHDRVAGQLNHVRLQIGLQRIRAALAQEE